MKKIFVSVPYTHNDKCIIDHRVREAGEYCAKLLMEKCVPICPVVSGHSIAELSTDTHVDLDHKGWLDYALSQLMGVDELHVLELSGWHESVGIQAELLTADKLGIPVIYIPVHI